MNHTVFSILPTISLLGSLGWALAWLEPSTPAPTEPPPVITGCDCTETIYLNETSDGGKVHKYEIDAAGNLTEVFNTGGTPWYPGTASSQLPAPHGLGIDLNGNLYIGETGFGDVRRLSCEGVLAPETEFRIEDGGFNFGTIDNSLYLNSARPTPSRNIIREYDLCTGNLVDELCLNITISNLEDWGFYLDPRTNVMYSTATSNGTTNQYDDIQVFRYTADDFGSPTCIDAFIEADDNVVNVGDNELPHGFLRGITTDLDGNIYIVMNDTQGPLSGASRSGRLLKYDPNGNFLAATPWDNTNTDPDGLFFALGVIYSEASNSLFISKGEPSANCIQQYSLDLVDLGVAVGPSTGSGTAKGISIVRECCPTNNALVIDTTLCNPTVGEQVFLQRLIGCQGGICEGTWTPDPANTGMTYNSCDNSVTIDAASGCGTFTLSSPGTAATNRCGAFTLTVHLTVQSLDMTVTQTDCTDTGNGTSTASYGAVVDFESDNCDGTTVIDVLRDGTLIGIISPGSQTSPQTIGFSVDADGAGSHTVRAQYRSTNCRADTTFSAPAPCPEPCVTEKGTVVIHRQ